jgi:pyruvate/2-oxoglutarate dehydrogenase complex dihydrolipoamide acyltransferase (E2) component
LVAPFLCSVFAKDGSDLRIFLKLQAGVAAIGEHSPNDSPSVCTGRQAERIVSGMRVELRIGQDEDGFGPLTIKTWRKSVGDYVQRGETVAEIEMNGRPVEIASPAGGWLVARLNGPESSLVDAGQVLAVVETQANSTGPAGLTIVELSSESQKGGAAFDPGTNGGHGPGNAAEQIAADAAYRHRLATGRAMSLAKREIPHFYLETEVRADAFEADRMNRAKHDAALAKATAMDYVVAACGRALKRYPRFNASFHAESPEIHIGVATRGPQGLLLPAIRHADRLALAEICAAREELISRARKGQVTSLHPTFSVASLAMYGIDRFCAIIPPGQVATLAIGATRNRLELADGQVRKARFLTLAMSFDHRVADAAEAAEFMAAVRRLLESKPGSL